MNKATYGGIAAALIIFLGTWSVGRLSNGEARELFIAVQPTVRFLSSSVMTATATILALILTLLSFSGGWESKFKSDHYRKVEMIAKMSTYTFIAALFLLMILSVPIIESENKLTAYYEVFYYGAQIFAAIVGGALITIALSIYGVAKDIILVLHPERDAEGIVLASQEED